MATIAFEAEMLIVKLSWLDRLFAIHGDVRVALADVTGAWAGDPRELHLQLRLLGTGLGVYKTAGIFTSREGVVFCSLSGAGACLMIETRGKPFPRIAVTLDEGASPQDAAHEIVRRTGPGFAGGSTQT